MNYPSKWRIPPDLWSADNPEVPFDEAGYAAWLSGVYLSDQEARNHARSTAEDERLRLSIRAEAEKAGFILKRSRNSGKIIYTKGDYTLSPVVSGWTINFFGKTCAHGGTVSEAVRRFEEKTASSYDADIFHG